MNMDRNTVIGFVLLAALLFIYLFTSTRNSQELAADQQKKADSVARVAKLRDSLALGKADTVKLTAAVPDSLPGFKKSAEENLLVVENELLRITFSNKGGQPKKVELKKYKSVDSTPVVLGGTEFDRFSYPVNSGANQSALVSDLYFTPGTVTKNADSSQTVSFVATGVGGETITHTFIIPFNNYLLDWNIQLNGADKLLTQGAFNFTWQSRPVQHESDVEYERQQTNICFYEDGDFDYIMSKTEKKFEKSIQWVSVAQQFFNTTIVAKTPFSSGDILFTRETVDSAKRIADVVTTVQAKLPIGSVAAFPLQLYYGPNDYKILNKQPVEDMAKIINLGRDMYAFVRPINRAIVMPVFDFFKSFIGSFGLVIALLTIFIRLATSPLVYTSYLSGAKMKALRPEIDKMKARLGGDQQAVGMEQMKLFREAGVNPLGGCIPALLQIPIFFALYSFFNSNIALRGESFLWADNLASYDVIVNFPFSVWGLGSHLSLFTLTAAATSFLISLYNANMTPDQSNPALKYMPYIFPFILLFIFNRLPSALTWYYTVSNIITLILQWIIQNYIIDHDKILAKLEANRKKPKTKSKWQERMEQMQETQKKMQELKNKPGKK
ncbi:MAG: membrane protein insertase YidC [Chitinophagaceae bacterium]|nr:membrane protein insertase YidC [Chitinophagaceae bacterium]